MNLSDIWTTLSEKVTGKLRQLRFPADCYADLFLGLNEENHRCLILYVSHGVIDKRKKGKGHTYANITLEFPVFEKYDGIIIILKNDFLTDVFDDLITALYSKISKETRQSVLVESFIAYFLNWASFFEPITTPGLTKNEIRGLLAEMLMLEFLLKNPTYCNNETLNGWKGPYDDEKDFFVNGFVIEVKSVSTASDEVRISSEYQLERVPSKGLLLVLVYLNEIPTGINLQEKFYDLRQIITSNALDLSFLLNALMCNNINQINIAQYNEFRFQFDRIDVYDATGINFPSIVKSEISIGIKNVSYNLVISSIEQFKVNPFNI